MSTVSSGNLVAHFISGRRVTPSGQRTIEVTSPLDGSIIGQVVAADATVVDQVVDSAGRGFATWSKTTVKARAQVLFRFKHLLETHIDEVSELASRENGKTRAEAEAGIRKGLEVVEYATSLPQLISGEILEVSPGVDCHSRRFPLGVVAGITPFNFPAMVPMWMFPIALGCGNAFIHKPSEQVPFTPLRLAELLLEAGLPEGVFNVVQGDRETVEAILDHPGVVAAAFVGSTPVARKVYERGQAAGKRTLALGGAKNHLIVLPDADPEITAQNVVASAYGCAGQRCMAASVLLAVKGSEPIIDRIEEETRKIRTGIDLGAIISRKALDRITAYIDRAEERGIRIRVDGRGVAVADRPDGYYFGATLLDEVPDGDESACDEIFGPVLPIIRVESLDEALAIENRSPFGNAASIYTSDGGAASYFEQQANSAMLGVNIGVPVPREPFSFGGWNDSRFGVGDITGRDAIHFWTKTKKVTTKWAASAARNWMT